MYTMYGVQGEGGEGGSGPAQSVSPTGMQHVTSQMQNLTLNSSVCVLILCCLKMESTCCALSGSLLMNPPQLHASPLASSL